MILQPYDGAVGEDELVRLRDVIAVPRQRKCYRKTNNSNGGGDRDPVRSTRLDVCGLRRYLSPQFIGVLLIEFVILFFEC